MKILPLQIRKDERGQLIQNEYPKIFKEIKHFFIADLNPGVTRGNHYHHNKKEWFLVIEGKIKISIKNIKTNKKKIIIANGSDPKLIEINPNTVHSFKNIGKEKATLIAFVNEMFNPQKPDTINC